jgi:hypothetical protein
VKILSKYPACKKWEDLEVRSGFLKEEIPSE